ncbi:hypothetical protein NM208_g1070 [Fusarium decemcellulare]|uniref:Uncharacterized protein n=1 Tax=Fusarium decemcellulare TaxID=57161 RepID=A0ACC1SXD9_9HYPO|nr:hypothetical protein NM208_g1070 [Fusarium decemcellulare]
MASQSPDAFVEALDRFRKTLTDEQKKQFSLSSLGDVEDAINNIQNNYGHRKQLRNMKRLSNFLEGMQQIEELVAIFLNVHEVVAFVWGPIKFVLNIAKNVLESFEVLLDTYVEVGEVIPRLREYKQIFKDYPSVREVLERCFYDILEFHKAALEVFTRTGWRKYFDYAWKTFRTRFKPILDSLKRHRELLSDEKLTATILEIQAGRGDVRAIRQTIETRFDELSRKLERGLVETRERETRALQESLMHKRRLISAQLCPGNYAVDQQAAFSQWSSSTSENWVLQDKRFKNWLQPGPNTDRVLYLHGMPGAGKTTLVSRIIDHLQSQKGVLKSPVLFFYFKSDRDDKVSMDCMVRALLDQFIYQDDSVVELLHSKYCSVSDSELMTASTLKQLLTDCLLTPHGGAIVLDGLDECKDVQRNAFGDTSLIIDWINESLIPQSLEKGYNVRFLLSSQHVDFLTKQLANHPSIRLDHDDGHLRNIRAYADAKAAIIQSRFGLDAPKTKEIADKVATASSGFFLYAKVVLKNLEDQGSVAELKEELKTENFPESLNKAYERVAIRVFDRGSGSKKAAASKILGWMACAARPLSWIHSSKRKKHHRSKVGLNSSSRRDLALTSYSRYLIQTRRICPVEQHVEAALFCSRYLVSRPFHEELPDQAVGDFALSGYYGFLDYAVAFWTHHLSSALKGLNSLPNESHPRIHSFAARTFPAFDTPDSNSPSSSRREIQEVQSMLQDWCGNISKCNLAKRLSIIRNAVESIRISDFDDKVKAVFVALNGTPCFKCPKPDCHNFNIGFIKSKDRDSHLNNHERPFKCSVPGCYFEIVGLRSQAELQTHSKFQHPDPGLLPLFPKPKLKSTPKKKVGIFEACANGDLDSVQAYLDLGGNVNKRHPRQPELTPLVMAARHGQTLACGLLMDNGATQILGTENDFDLRGRPVDNPTTACLEAMEQENYDLFWYLIHKAGQRQITQFTSPSSEIFRFYLTKSINLRDGQVFRYLLSLCDPTSGHRGQKYLDPDWLVYHIMSETTSVPQIEIALEWVFSTPLKPYRHPPMIGAEVPYNALTKKFGSTGDTMLHIACNCANLPIVRFLLNRLRQEDINRVNGQGQTPLFATVLADHDNTAILELLLTSDNGTAANMKDEKGRLPIHISCGLGKKREVELLIKCTHDLNVEDHFGNTPLIAAAQRGNVEPVRSLLETGRVDISRPNRDGRAAVYFAGDRLDMLVLLIHYSPSGLAYDLDLEKLVSQSGLSAQSLHVLLTSGFTTVAKVGLSTGKAFLSTEEVLNIWELAKSETDIELRVLVLLQGQIPQDIWLEQLSEIKKIFGSDPHPEYLVRLLESDPYARQVLQYQLGAEEYRTVLSRWFD